MKKKLMGMAALLAAAVLAGCGNGVGSDTSLNQMKVEQYVTLGDYRNMTVDVADAVVSDEEWNQLLLEVYRSYVTADNGVVTDRSVKNGDKVIIDYEGTKDGVAFSGGTAKGASLEIGSGYFIPGFEEGLVGAMPGETVKLNLTFPAGYKNNPALAGQAVVFTVTVQYILPGLDEMRDSVVADQKLDTVSSVEELRQYVYGYLTESKEQERLFKLQNAIIKQLTESSVIAELPDAYVQQYRESFLKNIERMAAYLNVTADDYSNYYYRVGSEDAARLYGEVQARQELMLQAIANEQGLNVNDEELEELMQEYALEAGYSSAADLQEEIPKEQLRNLFMSEKVMDYLVGIVDK